MWLFSEKYGYCDENATLSAKMHFFSTKMWPFPAKSAAFCDKNAAFLAKNAALSAKNAATFAKKCGNFGEKYVFSGENVGLYVKNAFFFFGEKCGHSRKAPEFQKSPLWAIIYLIRAFI